MNHLLLRTLAIFTGLLPLADPAPLAAEEDSEPQPSAVILVFDASGSMWGQIDGRPKIEIARETIADILADWNENREIGLMAYGHRRKGDCEDIETLIPVGPLQRDSFLGAVNDIVPKGKTPLTDSVERAAEALRISEEPASVILISDGKETCDRDPCAAAEKLAAQGVDFKAHVVGFDIADEEREGLRCLADETGGAFVAAGDAAELKSALQEVVAEVEKEEPVKKEMASGPGTLEFTMLASEGGDEVEGYYEIYEASKNVSGERKQVEKGDGPFELEPGKYFVEASWNRFGVINARTTREVEVKPGETTAVEIVIGAGVLDFTMRASEGGEEVSGWYVIYEAEKDLSGNRKKLEADEGPFKLAAGDYFVAASWDRYGVINARVTAEATVEAGKTNTVELVVDAGILDLTMVAAEGGDEIEGYYTIYEAEKDLSGNRKKLESDSDERYKLKEGKYLVTGRWGRYNDAVNVSEEVEITAGETTSVELVANAGVLQLTALSGEEEPVEAEFEIYEAEKDVSGNRKLVDSDDEPKFRLPEGKYFVVAKAGEEKAEAEVKITAGQLTEHTLTLE